MKIYVNLFKCILSVRFTNICCFYIDATFGCSVNNWIKKYIYFPNFALLNMQIAIHSDGKLTSFTLTRKQ